MCDFAIRARWIDVRLIVVVPDLRWILVTIEMCKMRTMDKQHAVVLPFAGADAR